MQEYQLREIVGLKKLDYGKLKLVYDYIRDNPGHNTSSIAEHLGMGKNVYRYRDLLFHYKLISEFNVLTDKTGSRISKYVFPKAIVDGNNEGSNKIVNLASLLSRFGDNDTIPGFNMTRADIVDKITTFTIKSPEVYRSSVEQALACLAISAIISNNVEAFKDMLNISPVTANDLESLLK